MYNKELYHHGTKGMRWGFRRYQNKDGSLTPVGKKRATQLESEYKALTGNNKKPKDLRSMTSREIQSAIKRKQLEDEYNRAMGTKQKGKYDVDDDTDAATSTKGFGYRDWETDRKSTRLNSSHSAKSRMPSSA